jgi:hypothetical protein
LNFDEGYHMMKCPFCHFENEDGALFCEQCKSDLGTAETISHVPPMAANSSSTPMKVAESMVETIPLVPLEGTATPVAAVVVEEPPVAQVAMESTVTLDASTPVAIPIVESTPIAASPVIQATPIPPVASPVASPIAEVAAPVPATPVAPPPQPETAAPPAQPDRLPPEAKPKLVVLRGQRVNAEYPLYEGENYIGRADEKAVDIDLEDQEPPDRIWSSRQHALITFEDGRLTIEDLKSLNGTFVNRLRLHEGQKRPLQINDVIQIGTVQMKVKV